METHLNTSDSLYIKVEAKLLRCPTHINVSCQPSSPQVHTFYEAIGYMIGAQTDQAVQELLIEKYMLLPNQVWDSIIQQATKVRRRIAVILESVSCSLS